MGDPERVRLVVLGGPAVGKSCIVKRFLFNTYSDKYRSTVEDLYTRDFNLGSGALKVDILDTSGELQFPAMRRLSVASAHAFLLVYALSSAASFACVQRCLREVAEQRGSELSALPVVVAGNKSDLAPSHREVALDDVAHWLLCEMPRLRAKVVEVSAKEDVNVREVFRALVTLSRRLPSASSAGEPAEEPAEEEPALRRRASAYLSGSRSASRRPALGGTEGAPEGGLKPRSRSLIRRSSRKAKQPLRDAQPPDDYPVS